MNVTTLITLALQEDKATRDITTQSFIPAKLKARARIIVKQNGVICGLGLIKKILSRLDTNARVRLFSKDGRKARNNTVVAEISASARALLSGERSILNFLQHLSGIATLTDAYVRALNSKKAKVYDTRKTLPGFRELEKYAVRCGGGANHRMDLEAMAMIKDNHLLLNKDIEASIRLFRSKYKGKKLEIECDTLPQVHNALSCGADIILLDNMPMGALKKAVAIIRSSPHPGTEIEVSGGVNLKSIKKYRNLPVDRVSVGALTHSAPALDISMEIETSMQN